MKRWMCTGEAVVYDKQSDQSRRRSDTGGVHRPSYKHRLFVSKLHSYYRLQLRYHVPRGGAGSCSDH